MRVIMTERGLITCRFRAIFQVWEQGNIEVAFTGYSAGMRSRSHSLLPFKHVPLSARTGTAPITADEMFMEVNAELRFLVHNSQIELQILADWYQNSSTANHEPFLPKPTHHTSAYFGCLYLQCIWFVSPLSLYLGFLNSEFV